MTDIQKIIHIDADCFYAAIEMRDNPALQDVPLAVGGRPGSRGVVATCNYKAREYGVRSAMSSTTAARKCPDLVFVKPRFPAYKEASKQIHEIFREYTDIIEPLSLDEAYLDVTHCKQHQGSATLIAEAIREKVKQQLDVTVSAGVAPNKFLAKIASDWNKPNGCFVIPPENVDDFVKQLPVKKINGVGKVTAEKLAAQNIFTCEDLQRLSLAETVKLMGSFGERLYSMARGIDKRKVNTERQRKSISVETTFLDDLNNMQDIQQEVLKLLNELEARFLPHSENYVATSRYVKIKTADFQQTTAEESISDFSEHWKRYEVYKNLSDKAWRRHQKTVRLIGVGIKLKSLDDASQAIQRSLFE